MTSEFALSRWQAYRRLLDRVTRNVHYRYEDAQKWGYLAASDRIAENLRVWNSLYWDIVMERVRGHEVSAADAADAYTTAGRVRRLAGLDN